VPQRFSLAIPLTLSSNQIRKSLPALHLVAAFSLLNFAVNPSFNKRHLGAILVVQLHSRQKIAIEI
jgi:hypothetical protein